MNKKERQKILLKLIHLHEIITQEELMDWLMKEEVYASQATISRDIKELQLVKIPAALGGKKYAKNKQPSSQPFLMQQVKSLHLLYATIVVETLPGNAFLLKKEFKKNFPQLLILNDDDTLVLYFENPQQASLFYNKNFTK